MERPEILVVGNRPDWYLARLAEDFTVHQAAVDDPAGLDPSVAARVEAVASAGVLRRQIIEALPRLRIVANGGAGYEKIDFATLQARGIALTNAPGVTDGCVADMAFALLLAVGRHITQGDAFVRSGRWSSSDYSLVPRLYGRPVGILGLGRIGMAIARRAAGFDMPIFYHNRRPRTDVDFTYCESVVELARRSDYLVIACPGGADTYHIVGAEAIAALGPTGIVVNIARGSIIDEQALISALRAGQIMGAGLDVLEHEPAVPSELLTLKNVVLMPHRGGGTLETWRDACDLVKANLKAHFSGRPLLTPVLEEAVQIAP